MSEGNQPTNPKLIVAIQMLCIGLVLFVLGIAVTLASPVKSMTPLFRTWSIISNGSIILTGLAFTIGGIFRLRNKQGT